MTICIAAVCDVSATPKIVVCTDWRASSALGSADTHLKQRAIGHGLVLLTSGNRSDILGFEKTADRLLLGSKITTVNICQVLRDAVRERKNEKAQDYVGGKFGLTYDDFLASGKDKFPAEIFRETMAEIRSMTLGAEFILVGFDDMYPLMVEVSSSGTVSIRDQFACIGEGTYLAQASLLNRQQQEPLSLDRTLYDVFEAKKMAEAIGSVGTLESITVLYPGGKRDLVNDTMRKALQALFEQVRARAIPSFTIDPKDLQPLVEGEKED